MRKREQQQILTLLQTIRDAQAEGAYADCQNGALAVGEYIEGIEGKGTQTVALLEEYCDLLFKVHSGEIGKNQLRNHLVKIENSVRSELRPNKIEVAFFPYKASMADSFETIYLAAKADPQCDAYWVPIPYVDRTAALAYGDMHYEGDLYPEKFEVTDWREYDVEARHPDIAFIHNPYDDRNYLSTVHQDYYSSALKEKVDFLVYVEYGIPYRIHRDPALLTYGEFTRVSPFLLNSDLVVSYSVFHTERIRLALLNNHHVTSQFTRQQIIDKIVALGSAKFDKVVNSTKEDHALPDDWGNLIGRKKVLLYITSLSDLIKGEEKSLDEIANVIDISSKRNDIVLWWRPHPITVDTLKNMRAGLKDRYATIVAKYKSSGLGIFDDTPDAHRAIAWSDGCLTNFSSLMFMYLASGKPFTVLSESIRLPKNLYDRHLTTFHEPLQRRIDNMKSAKGANVRQRNTCIWWRNFLSVNVIDKIRYDNAIEVFLDYIVHMDDYAEAEEYRQLQLQMFKDFVVNPDGTAGEKIYQYCKEHVNK